LRLGALSIGRCDMLGISVWACAVCGRGGGRRLHDPLVHHALGIHVHVR
jgi:hypothetical protein